MSQVLLGAESEETIHKTHSHYFVERTADLFERFLADAVKVPPDEVTVTDE